MWGCFLKIKRALFGKSHQTSLSEKIIDNRTSILGRYGNVGQPGLTVPYQPDSKKDVPITSTELASYFVKDGLDIPGQISTYYSEVGMGGSVGASIDVAKLVGLGVQTPDNFPIKAKFGLEAKAGASLALSGAKGTLLFIEFQPDIAGYQHNELKVYTPVCFGAMTGGKADVELGVTASAGVVAKASVSVEPFEGLEIAAFDFEARALSVEAGAKYSGTGFMYRSQNLRMYPKVQDALYPSIAKDISDVIDKKKKISDAVEGKSVSWPPIAREASFCGWIQTGDASVKASLFNFEGAQGSVGTSLDGWYSVSASLLNAKVDLLTKNWEGELKRLVYTFETPARGGAAIRHQVKVNYTMTQSSFAICALQLNAGNIKAELFTEKEGDSTPKEIARSGANFYADKLTSKVNEKANNVCPVFYDNTKSSQQLAVNKAIKYTDIVTYLTRDNKAVAGSGCIYGQSVNLNTLKRFVDLYEYYPKMNYLKEKDSDFIHAMSVSDIPQCTGVGLSAMKNGLEQCFSKLTEVMTLAQFEVETDKTLNRKSIKAADTALQAFHKQYKAISEKLSSLTELTDEKLILWGIDIDLLLGLLGTIEDNLVLWAINKGKNAAKHKRANGIGLLLQEIDSEKRRIYSQVRDILFFKEFSQLTQVLKSLSKAIHTKPEDTLTFLLYNSDLITSLTLDPGVTFDAVLIESSYAYSLDNRQQTNSLESMRLRYRMADGDQTNTTLFKLGFSLWTGISANISLKYFDQYKSEGIVNLSTYWFGDKARFNSDTKNPDHFVPPAVLITE